MNKFYKFAIPFLAMVDVAGIYAWKAIPAAAQERGYWAIGGEYLLIPFLAWAGWAFGSYLADLAIRHGKC